MQSGEVEGQKYLKVSDVIYEWPTYLMRINSKLLVNQSSNVRLGNCSVNDRDDESGRLIEKKDRERNLDLNRVNDENSVVLTRLE